jgi:hypothetical protein
MPTVRPEFWSLKPRINLRLDDLSIFEAILGKPRLHQQRLWEKIIKTACTLLFLKSGLFVAWTRVCWLKFNRHLAATDDFVEIRGLKATPSLL